MTKKPVPGQCYENNFRHLMEMVNRGESVRGWRLCHGVAIGSGPINGVSFGHSWLEYTVGSVRIVFDATYSRTTPAALYYHVGQIGTVISYTYKHATRLALRHGTYGPWHPLIQKAAHGGPVTRRKRR